jgi:transketolase
MPADQATDLANLTINTIRGLAMDAVQKANSGHPGMPMGAAVMAYALFARHLRFDPQAPKWFDRDRFILSAGHGSMLLYSMLYLLGYDLSIEDIKSFRQWGSKTPGHPENTVTPGVEMATGPLGQGFATGVGMAIAEEKLRAEFPGLIDHWTYAICSDGDLMEGISHEAASLAGHLRLGRLIYLYDSNRVTIDGSTDISFSEDIHKRFESCGWHVQRCDGMSVDSVDSCISIAKGVDRPSLIICDTVIGYGSPNMAGTSRTHGAPLGEEEVRLTKIELGIPTEPLFYVPNEALAHMREIGKRHANQRIESERQIQSNPELARRIAGELPDGWTNAMPVFDSAMATRDASGKIVNTLAKALPELVGGSADLAESNKTTLHDSPYFSVSHRMGRNLGYGVREHAMAAAMNGMNLHGGVRAYGGTFLIFSDYMRPAVRLSSLMETNTVFVYSHDSIGLGEDGPTHQPIEHIMSLRTMPHIHVFRPADANETRAAWKHALESKDHPTAIVLSRQKLPLVSPPTFDALRGAYVLVEATGGAPNAVLIGTGSEVEICLIARDFLESSGIPTRVVSMPCWELFEAQDESYRISVLPPSVLRVSVEAGATLGWQRWIGETGIAIGIDRFGASAPYQEIYEQFGLTGEAVAERVKKALSK